MSEATISNIAEKQGSTKLTISAEQYESIANIQQETIEMIAIHAPSDSILSHLCHLAENLLPNSVASIMLKDKKTGLISVLSAPSVPLAGWDALSNLTPGPGAGSCGNAIFKNEPQYVYDTFKDPRWIDLKQLAIDFNLCSCWSAPVTDKQHDAIGTFALSSFEHRNPESYHRKILETCASIVKIVLQNKAKDERIQLFAEALNSSSEGVMITNKENKIVEVNHAFLEAYGYTNDDVIGQNPSFLSSKKHDDLFYKNMWQELHAKSKWNGEIVDFRADGSKITQWVSIGALRDDNNEITNHIAIFTDLTELKNNQKRIETLALTDAVTGLANKAALEKQLGANNKNKTLLFININNFSYINTAYGFELGDKLLAKIAMLLKSEFNQKNVFRLNSDEYGFLIENSANPINFIHQIQDYFYKNTLHLEGITLNISFTYGVASGKQSLSRNAALALKQAKEKGRNHYHVFNDDQDSVGVKEREAFIISNNILHDALENNRVVPFFQGIRNNKTKEIVRYEALARIEKEGKYISPFSFLEPARLSGLLPEITKAMIDNSFKVMSETPFSFSINITEDDLSMNYLEDYLQEKSVLYGIAPNRVILEILEGVSSGGKDYQVQQLEALKAQGYSLAIDDFGAEYSNFERILDLDIDFLKIDAKYIKDINSNPKSYEITKAIAYFAQNAGIPCIAEFVHNEKVQKIVEDLGIDYSQGFYFSEPRKDI